MKPSGTGLASRSSASRHHDADSRASRHARRRPPLLPDAARLHARLPRGDAAPLQDDGIVATLLQRERDRDAGDAAAYDDDVRHEAASAAAAAAFRRTTSSVFSSSTVGVNSTASLSSRNEMRWPGST